MLSMLLNATQALVAVGAAVLAAFALFKGEPRTFHGFRLPPGPRPVPLIGNILSIDPRKPWTTYARWGARYGDIFTIRVLKQAIIVINSKKIAKDLLDRRSNIYSDRPYLAMKDAYGLSFNFALAPYGDEWRTQRRLFNQAFRAKVAPSFRPIQLRQAHQLVLDISNSPHDFYKHIQRFSMAVIMSIVYDYEVSPDSDHLVELFEHGNALVLEALAPETSIIIDTFSFVLGLPEWFPGSIFSRKAALSKRIATQMIEEAFEHARKRQTMGSNSSAMALDLLRETKDCSLSHIQLLKNTCASAFVAGAETTTSTLQCFMVAMLRHPEVQERAWAEIDAVVGKDRLPNFDDRPNLPYVESILIETLRLYPVVPLGIPHATTVDDVYEDIFVPKGSTVVANIWAMHHNEDAYPESDVFKPERFFADGKLNGDKSIDSLAFGFGRRMCPGRYAADGTLWAAIVSILHVFKITKALDERGEALEFEPSFSHGLTTAPDPFPCSITSRLLNIDINNTYASTV